MIQPRHKRLVVIGLVALFLCAALYLALQGLRQNVTYFLTPSDVRAQQQALLSEAKNFRLGGMVKKGSLQKTNKGLDLLFTVTDFHHELRVRYHGLPPDLFREGQGVVAEGHLIAPRLFEATLLLAKHDEKYMPPEMGKRLKRKTP